MTALPGWLDRNISEPRFRPYLDATGGDPAPALELYQWNIAVASAFYTPLHWLEVTLRNALHHELRSHFGRPDWWATAPLADNGRRAITRAHTQLTKRKAAGCPDDLVTELSLGFWVSLLSRGLAYDRTLWVPALHRAFPHHSGRRHDLHADLFPLLHFRNRIMHHEPIHQLDLRRYHSTIYRLLGYVSPQVSALSARLDRTPALLDNRPDATRGATS
ncbi:hypothetical protein [Amycolatopsis sp. NPDC051128]|uniref:hypothetical protein n=1 Tax=Amycolatopsis sp. NPDC051128 TaxID=3155412 RepID=UPI0034135C04